MHFKEDLIEPLLNEIMYYEPGSVDVESFTDEGQGRYRVDIHIYEAPRDESEFFGGADSDYDIGVTTSVSDHDNAPSDTVIRVVHIIDRDLGDEDSNDVPCLESLSFTRMTIALAGDLSAPDYSDDESDASLYGTLFIEFESNDWAIEESRVYCCDRIQRAITATMQTLTEQIKTLREHGETRPIAPEAAKDIIRHALAA